MRVKTLIRAGLSRGGRPRGSISGHLTARTIATFGRLDVVFDNAGVQGPITPLQDTTEADWRRIVEVNLTGTFLCLKHQIPALLAGGGAIVNHASTLGVIGAPGLSSYSAAKHGVIGLTRSAALELAPHNVRVNALVTGTTDSRMADQFLPLFAADPTRLGPTGRLATPDEIVSFATYLLSDEAGYITGAALPIDGGTTAR